LREHAGGGVRPLAVVDGLPLRAVVPGGFAPVLTGVVLGLLGGPQVTVVVGDARFGFHGQPVVGEVGVGVVVVVLPLLVLYSEEGGGLQADGAPSGAVVEDDVLVDLHVTVVCCVDECLVVGALRFQAWVDPVEVVPVVAVKVVVGAVQDHGGDPDRRESEALDVVQAVDQPGEVTPEHRVVVLVVACFLVVAAPSVVLLVTVVESRGHREVDRFLAGVAAEHLTGARRVCGVGAGGGRGGGEGEGHQEGGQEDEEGRGRQPWGGRVGRSGGGWSEGVRAQRGGQEYGGQRGGG